MPLDLNALQAAVEKAFQKAKDTPSPTDPAESGQVQTQVLEQLAQDLAAAIDSFVRSGDVTGVTVAVVESANHPVGTQTGTGRVE